MKGGSNVDLGRENKTGNWAAHVLRYRPRSKHKTPTSHPHPSDRSTTWCTSRLISIYTYSVLESHRSANRTLLAGRLAGMQEQQNMVGF